jgi:predicted nucleic acid-binding protein
VVVVDTSVWIDHLRRGDPHLRYLLRVGQVAIHPFVVGEIVCGSLANRGELLTLLQVLG